MGLFTWLAYQQVQLILSQRFTFAHCLSSYSNTKIHNQRLRWASCCRASLVRAFAVLIYRGTVHAVQAAPRHFSPCQSPRTLLMEHSQAFGCS
jgi:hypothetical protein